MKQRQIKKWAKAYSERGQLPGYCILRYLIPLWSFIRGRFYLARREDVAEGLVER